VRLLLAAALAVSLPLHAETYKWVDEKGVTNYSSSPPAAAAKAKVIEERVSVMPADPSLQTAVADMRAQALRRQEYVEQEYLQRQRLSVEKAMLAMVIPECPYRSECGDGYIPYAYPGYAYAAYPGSYGRSVLRSPGYGPGLRPGHGAGFRPGYYQPGPRPAAARGTTSGALMGYAGGGRR
jgi:hypothetical protein